MKQILIIFSLLVLFLGQGCYYDNEEELYPLIRPPVISDTVSVSYKDDVVPILEAKCYACHDALNYQVNGNGILLEGYENVKIFAANGKLYGVISWSPGFQRMPLRGNKIPAADIALIRKWVDDGYPDN